MNWQVAAAVIVIGLSSCLVAILTGLKAYRLRCYGTNTQGRVIDTSYGGFYHSNTTVEFTDRRGQRVTFNTLHARRVARDELVRVKYLPDNPHVAEVHESSLIADSAYCLMIGLIFLVWFFSELIARRVS